MLHLLPQPRYVSMEEGSFTLSQDMRIVKEHTRTGFDRAAIAQLQDEITSACGFRPMSVCGGGRTGDILLRNDSGGTEDAYTLHISPEGVTVAANSHSGVLCGVQTLRQIIRQCGWTLPALTIRDAPVYAARGFYHDVTRGRVPTLDWLKRLADEMCFYKLNQLQLYVEHSYLFRDLPELHGVAVTPLTAEEIMELDDYCFRRGIELVPSLSTFGHLFELLRTKRFAHLCELPGSEQMASTMPGRMAHHTIDPTNPESLALVLSMIDEYMLLFRSRKFNICADETFDLGKGRSAAAFAEKGEKAVYIDFVKALCEHVVSRGRTPMFWGDIVVKFADALRELPEGTICLNWGYAADVTDDSTRIFAKARATQYVCPGVSGWNQWMPRLKASCENIRSMAEYGVKGGAVGLLNTDWGDYGHINDPRFSLPGLIAGACAAWNGTLPHTGDLLESISRLAYSDRSGRVCAALAALADTPVYSWWHIVRDKEDRQGVLTDPWGSPDRQPVPEECFQAAQRKVAEVETALRMLSRQMDPAQRPMIARWMIAAEAIRLWDAAYHAVLKGTKSVETADALEVWLTRYEAMWREVSKESELWRIRDVTVWYAQQLREAERAWN